MVWVPMLVVLQCCVVIVDGYVVGVVVAVTVAVVRVGVVVVGVVAASVADGVVVVVVVAVVIVGVVVVCVCCWCECCRGWYCCCCWLLFAGPNLVVERRGIARTAMDLAGDTRQGQKLGPLLRQYGCHRGEGTLWQQHEAEKK